MKEGFTSRAATDCIVPSRASLDCAATQFTIYFPNPKFPVILLAEHHVPAQPPKWRPNLLDHLSTICLSTWQAHRRSGHQTILQCHQRFTSIIHESPTNLTSSPSPMHMSRDVTSTSVTIIFTSYNPLSLSCFLFTLPLYPSFSHPFQ